MQRWQCELTKDSLPLCFW